MSHHAQLRLARPVTPRPAGAGAVVRPGGGWLSGLWGGGCRRVLWGGACRRVLWGRVVVGPCGAAAVVRSRWAGWLSGHVGLGLWSVLPPGSVVRHRAVPGPSSHRESRHTVDGVVVRPCAAAVRGAIADRCPCPGRRRRVCGSPDPSRPDPAASCRFDAVVHSRLDSAMPAGAIPQYQRMPTRPHGRCGLASSAKAPPVKAPLRRPRSLPAPAKVARPRPPPSGRAQAWQVTGHRSLVVRLVPGAAVVAFR